MWSSWRFNSSLWTILCPLTAWKVTSSIKCSRNKFLMLFHRMISHKSVEQISLLYSVSLTRWIFFFQKTFQWIGCFHFFENFAIKKHLCICRCTDTIGLFGWQRTIKISATIITVNFAGYFANWVGYKVQREFITSSSGRKISSLHPFGSGNWLTRPVLSGSFRELSQTGCLLFFEHCLTNSVNRLHCKKENNLSCGFLPDWIETCSRNASKTLLLIIWTQWLTVLQWKQVEFLTTWADLPTGKSVVAAGGGVSEDQTLPHLNNFWIWVPSPSPLSGFGFS